MPQYVNQLILKFSAITIIAALFFIILNIWILPIIYEGEKKRYIFYPVLILTVALVSWLTFIKVPIDSVPQKICVSFACGIAVAAVALFIALLVILNTLGA